MGEQGEVKLSVMLGQVQLPPAGEEVQQRVTEAGS